MMVQFRMIPDVIRRGGRARATGVSTIFPTGCAKAFAATSIESFANVESFAKSRAGGFGTGRQAIFRLAPEHGPALANPRDCGTRRCRRDCAAQAGALTDGRRNHGHDRRCDLREKCDWQEMRDGQEGSDRWR
jgi:hypothetical protein